MKSTVFKLLSDYPRRTLGAWMPLALVMPMQASALWALGIDRVPLLGAVVGAMAFFATFASPQAVMKTLPVSPRHIALTRWWMAIGIPFAFLTACLFAAWGANLGWGIPAPDITQVILAALENLAVLGLLSVLPLPMLNARRSNFGLFVGVWISLAAAALYGFAPAALTVPASIAIGVEGLALALISYVQAMRGRVVQIPAPPIRRRVADAADKDAPRKNSKHSLRGWNVLALQLLRMTAALAIACTAAITIVRTVLPGLESILPQVFVSVAGIAGGLLARRWLLAMGMMQTLPIRHYALALIMCLVLMAPGALTCLVAAAAHQLNPAWGVTIPLSIIPVFTIVPALLVPWQSLESSHAVTSTLQRWAPVLQLTLWPLWAAPFCSLTLTKLVPAWFDFAAVAIVLVFAATGYFAILMRIRAGPLTVP